MIFGLAAALGWGLADVMVALVARRIGSFATVVLSQIAGVLMFTALLASPGFSLPHGRATVFIVVAIGVLGAISYLAFYRALELGPVSLVTPIVAGYAAIVILLALSFLGESIRPVALAGATVTVGGVVLASVDPRALRAAVRTKRGGVFFALLAMAGFGIGAFLVGAYAKDLGWFASTYLSRLGSLATLMTVWGVTRQKGIVTLSLPVLGVGALIGIFDILGFASFARGSELGRVSITAAASVTYPLIPIIAGILYLKERPAASQWLGVALVFGGLVVLALGGNGTSG